MRLKFFQVDAFTDHLFGGNPAAVVPLDEWLPPATMQKIASEIICLRLLSRKDESFDLRWFSPTVEVNLCGHATLASAHVLLNHLGHQEPHMSFLFQERNINSYKRSRLADFEFAC